MADDKDQQQSGSGVVATPGAPAPASGGSAESPKRIPRGVVLGPDGKPCRNCTSFASWAAQTKETIKGNEARAKAANQGPPADCPPDVEVLGRSTWTLLHSIAATYPENPSNGQKSDLLSFVSLFSKLYPCWVCAEDFQGYLKRDAPKVGSRDEFGKWLCGAHNDVNRKLGKPEFDCSKWQERWRTGWKDGRCD
ncbi:ERV/ALR sulfhydryl oxidase domain-containing protein [Thelonectria olida]|uniref:Sulfhydryl oxidase n=1 Tax=Thelonectria olida TaxID=1576542 RepID=A0A9P8W4Y3_9HYPO|nr:ERV/ALR sulfhydryl oxidase domain-containing protein [Thelonectria olida]